MWEQRPSRRIMSSMKDNLYYKDSDTIEDSIFLICMNLAKIFLYSDSSDVQKWNIEICRCTDHIRNIRSNSTQSIEENTNLATARQFVQDVAELAKMYGVNYYVVTDGASSIHNDESEAVQYARESMKQWEQEHGIDPDEDWSQNVYVTSDSLYYDSFLPLKSSLPRWYQLLQSQHGQVPGANFNYFEDRVDSYFKWLSENIDNLGAVLDIRVINELRKLGF